MASLTRQFAEQNIIIKLVEPCVDPNHYTFLFDGSEEQFVESLQRVMDLYGYSRASGDWFPVINGEMHTYYIEKTNRSDDTCMAFNWYTKEMFIG